MPSIAQQLHALGIAVVPASGKRPALASWIDYLHQRPSADDLRGWIDAGLFDNGIGVLSGVVSGVVCLDFDDQQLANRFAQVFPALATVATYRERTPSGGQHWWYRLPTGANPRTRKLATGELRAAGAFTVIAPSPGYAALGGSWDDLRKLTPDELRGVEAFFTPAPLLSKYSETQQTPAPTADLAGRLISVYDRAAINGRNNALFTTAIQARDAGLSQTAVVEALLHRFASDHPHIGTKNQRAERYEIRQTEARATIRSAFSKPARPTGRTTGDNASIPNTIRERLLQLKQAATARVFEALATADKMGQTLSTPQIVGICQSAGIGRYSVLKALDFAINSKTRIFTASSRDTHVVGESSNSKKQNAELQINAIEGGKNRIKSAGRPTAYYTVPTVTALALLLGVEKDGGADDLPTEARTTAKGYRMAVHRALIARRPAQYAAAWLARRIGVTKRTIRNYNKRLSVVVTAVVETVCDIVRENAAQLLEHARSAVNPAQWLEDGRGRRYPALAGLAFKLLGERRRLVLKYQAPNFYSIDRAF